MLTDNFNRPIDYLRVSVIDRCNLRCLYCRAMEESEFKPRKELLNFEELVLVVAAAVSLGIDCIRFTGGEPLIRRNFLHFVREVAHISGIRDLALTTNGILLKEYAGALKDAGIKRINVSLDTLDKERFFSLAGGELNRVLDGIDSALEIGIFVKLNVVLMRGINEGEVRDFLRFGKERGVVVRFIELMPVKTEDFWGKDKFISVEEIIRDLGEVEEISMEGSGPARYYRIKGAGMRFGVISPLSDSFCAQCNRLRVSADGFLQSCLESSERIDLKGALRQGAVLEEIAALIEQGVRLKPEAHSMGFQGSRLPCGMVEVGG